MPRQTPSQTIGPFFAYALTPEPYGRPGIVGNRLAGEAAEGERIRIEGRLLDGAGEPVTDALLEIWQADSRGRYAHPADDRPEPPRDPAFRGFGRAGTDERGGFVFETVKPGPVPGRGNALQAPHINLIVSARGMLDHVFTRIYFSDETEANETDPVLGVVEPARRGTLIATRRESAGGAIYRFDIHLQGDSETVFFDA